MINFLSKLFAKKEWEYEVLPQISGQYNNISVTLINFPCKKEIYTNVRKFIYDDFGADFLSELCDRYLSNYETVIQGLLEKEKMIQVVMPKAEEFIVKIKLNIDNLSTYKTPDKSKFYSDLLDAIIKAFEKVNLK